MTYESEPKSGESDLVARVTDELDSIDEKLPNRVVSDITAARYAAMRKHHEHRASMASTKTLPFGLSSKLAWTLGATPAAVALLALVLVSYGSGSGIPELPSEWVSEDISAQDLMLVNNMELAQDLEFADWLSQQNEEDLL